MYSLDNYILHFSNTFILNWKIGWTLMNIFTDTLFICTKCLPKNIYMINTRRRADCIVISSVSMIPCTWFHCSKQLSRRLAFYFNDFAFSFLEKSCILIGSCKFFMNCWCYGNKFFFWNNQIFFCSWCVTTLTLSSLEQQNVLATYVAWLWGTWIHYIWSQICVTKCFYLINLPILIQITTDETGPLSKPFDGRA